MMKSALSRYNDLTQRFVTGAFGAVVIIGSVIYGEWTYFAVFLLICIMTQLEFYRLLRLDDMLPLVSWGTFSGVTIFIIVFLEQNLLIKNKYYFLSFILHFLSNFIVVLMTNPLQILD